MEGVLRPQHNVVRRPVGRRASVIEIGAGFENLDMPAAPLGPGIAPPQSGAFPGEVPDLAPSGVLRY